LHEPIWDEERTSRVRVSGQEVIYVSTVGRDEETVRNYIKHQEEEDKRIEQLDLFKAPPPLGGT